MQILDQRNKNNIWSYSFQDIDSWLCAVTSSHFKRIRVTYVSVESVSNTVSIGKFNHINELGDDRSGFCVAAAFALMARILR